MFAPQGAIAQSPTPSIDDLCPAGTESVALNVVGGEGTTVEKTPRNPTFPIPLPGPLPSITIRDNFNTDWAIPTTEIYQKYVIAIAPEDTDDYDIEVNLKYGDDEHDEIYDRRSTDLTEGEVFLITAEPRQDLQPYQVNVRVGDEAIGNRYTAAVVGCRTSATPPPPLVERGTCMRLMVVGGRDEQNTVEKRISVPTVTGPFGIGVRNNWNTDWIVPVPQQFRSFIAMIDAIDEDGSSDYDIELNLKYNDDTSDEIFDQDEQRISTDEPLRIDARPRADNQPYQVNVFVGGVDHVGDRYQASVYGCY
ncbi:hypothetical protein [Spirulina major]|uniref:hypothetical protein n=1 Tax=Spirulina major TaxID=270636 RepID=UPI001114C7A9|nr:hypothetical protein [Spirulina major]